MKSAAWLATAGRRRAVGFRQIVPGVFPTGVVTPMKPAAAKVAEFKVEWLDGDWPWVSGKLSQRSAGVVIDRLRSIVVGPWCSIHLFSVDFRCYRYTLLVFMA